MENEPSMHTIRQAIGDFERVIHLISKNRTVEDSERPQVIAQLRKSLFILIQAAGYIEKVKEGKNA